MPRPALYLPRVVLGEIRYYVDIVVAALSREDVPVDPDSRTGGPLPLVYAELYRVGVILYRVRVCRYGVGVGAHAVRVRVYPVRMVGNPVRMGRVDVRPRPHKALVSYDFQRRVYDSEFRPAR